MGLTRLALPSFLHHCPCAAVQSLVLDLRDNRGGLVSEGLEVARLFLSGARGGGCQGGSQGGVHRAERVACN